MPSSDLPPKLVDEASAGRAWFCLCSQPKHEHIVAAHLRQMEDVEVFLPQVRFKRATRRGMTWVTEALFPGYLFTKFDWKSSLRRVQAVSGCRGVVHFGNQWPVIPESTMEELRSIVGPKDVHVISQDLEAGDAVRVTDGTLSGLSAIVSHVTSGRERVAVLMDLLGRQTMVELKTSSIIKKGDSRAQLLK